eukprot:2243594-Pleurochrysis_carterae.AAC.1
MCIHSMLCADPTTSSLIEQQGHYDPQRPHLRPHAAAAALSPDAPRWWPGAALDTPSPMTRERTCGGDPYVYVATHR